MTGDNEGWEKRGAGQHALQKGQRSAFLWGLAGATAGTVGLKGIERHARRQERAARRTWVAGGEAEMLVGRELSGLTEHGFYVFHDVQLPRLGNVDHVALGPRGIFAIETKSHRGTVTRAGDDLLFNGRVPERDAIGQAWRGSYRVQEIVGHRVTPLLVFSRAFVQGRVTVKGVRVLPLEWLVSTMLEGETDLGPGALKRAVGALSRATGCYPSAPRPGAPGARRPPSEDGEGPERSGTPWVHFGMSRRDP